MSIRCSSSKNSSEEDERLEFLDQPRNDTPHDQLLLQIRGAVAEYERSLIGSRECGVVGGTNIKPVVYFLGHVPRTATASIRRAREIQQGSVWSQRRQQSLQRFLPATPKKGRA
jgi:hypothetical protein